MLRRLLIVSVVAGLALAAAYRLHSRPLPRFVGRGDPPRGVFHVHSDLSHDGRKSLHAISAAAAELGLEFVVVTDHNRKAESHGGDVSILAGSELSTPFGHLIELGAQAPLTDDERGAVQVHATLRARGGTPILAHPRDRKRPWDGPIEGIGGLEIANAAASLRAYGGVVMAPLVPLLIALRVRPELALMQLYDPDPALELWDRESDPGVVGVCAVDAHGRIELSLEMRLWQLVLEEPLPENAAARPAALLERLRTGRFHCVAAALGDPPRFTFNGERDGATVARPGDTIDDLDALSVDGPQLRSGAGFVVLLRDGQELLRVRGNTLRYANPGPGTYRVEVHATIPGLLFGERTVPVIYSNRIRVAR